MNRYINFRRIISRSPSLLCLLFLGGLTAFASPVAAQVFDSGPSESALFDTVINVPPAPDIGLGGVIGGNGSTSQLNVSDGGSVERFFTANSGSEVIITGGEVGSFFDADDGSEVNISGGSVGVGFQASSGSAVNISGGSVGRAFGAFPGSVVNISGGSIGNDFVAISGSEVNLIGNAFFLDGELISGRLPIGQAFTIGDRDVTLSGRLIDGTEFSFNLDPIVPVFELDGDYFDSGATLTVTQSILLGDSGDGVVDFNDIPWFIWALRKGDYLAAADVNQDGVLDFGDIRPFIELLRGSSDEAVPFTDLPVVSGRGQQQFRDLLVRAETESIRIGIFGDSNETPGGFGTTFIAALNRFAFEHLGVLSETPFAPGGTSYGSATSSSRFLSSKSNNGGSVISGQSWQLPVHRAYRTGQVRGDLYRLLKDGQFNPGSDVGQTYYDVTTGTSAVEVFYRTDSGSSQEAIVEEFDLAVGNFFAVPDATHVSSGLNLNGSTGDIVKFTTPNLTTPVNGTWQLIARGGDVVGWRIIDTADRGGMTFTSFSQGGYQSISLAQNHPTSLNTYRDIGPWDATILSYQTNDCMRRTLEEYESVLRGWINALRTSLNDPNHHVIFVSDIKVFNDPARCDLYASVQHRIANDTDNVTFVNQQKTTCDFTAQDYASDNVHLNDTGQIRRAEDLINIWKSF